MFNLFNKQKKINHIIETLLTENIKDPIILEELNLLKFSLEVQLIDRNNDKWLATLFYLVIIIYIVAIYFSNSILLFGFSFVYIILFYIVSNRIKENNKIIESLKYNIQKLQNLGG
jgi:hypothetical protein|tara:strand:- start:411 stop:758 length:348 start_codon:yes stop_codon:yes gene_type:complete